MILNVFQSYFYHINKKNTLNRSLLYKNDFVVQLEESLLVTEVVVGSNPIKVARIIKILKIMFGTRVDKMTVLYIL